MTIPPPVLERVPVLPEPNWSLLQEHSPLASLPRAALEETIIELTESLRRSQKIIVAHELIQEGQNSQLVIQAAYLDKLNQSLNTKEKMAQDDRTKIFPGGKGRHLTDLGLIDEIRKDEQRRRRRRRKRRKGRQPEKWRRQQRMQWKLSGKGCWKAMKQEWRVGKWSVQPLLLSVFQNPDTRKSPHVQENRNLQFLLIRRFQVKPNLMMGMKAMSLEVNMMGLLVEKDVVSVLLQIDEGCCRDR
jgi:hypothetical protein